jgi:hypothetical protein
MTEETWPEKSRVWKGAQASATNSTSGRSFESVSLNISQEAWPYS